MKTKTPRHRTRPFDLSALAPLEERCLLSAAHGIINTIPFSSAPVAVQTGLDTLATTDSLSDPSATQNVYLGNNRGVETYTVDLATTGKNSVLTVDQKGNPVTAPVKSSTTFGGLTNAAVTAEITAIAAALNLTAPASTTSVSILTNSDDTAVYTVTLTSADSTSHHPRSTTFSVDSNGDPTGNQRLPLSVFSSAIQNGLTSNAPAGATPLTSTSSVTGQTNDGVTTYSATYQSTGIRTTVTVDATGALADLPSTSSTQFSLIPAPAQTELQTLAAANGYAGTISDTQKVAVYDEANGTTIYAVHLPVTGAGKSGSTYTYMIAVASDQDGNPTVPPQNGLPGFGGFNGFDGGFGFGGGYGGFSGFSRFFSHAFFRY